MNLLTIQTFKDDTIARSFLNYEDYDKAISALYSTMASASANINMKSCICIIISDDGSLYKQEVWEAIALEE